MKGSAVVSKITREVNVFPLTRRNRCCMPQQTTAGAPTEDPMATRYWLMKSEPNVFSFDDLQKAAKQTTTWDGVRNYQARNMLRSEMSEGDGVLFYHSRVEPMAVVGVAKVVRTGFPDPTQFNAKHKYFDGESDPGKPRWYAVDIQFYKAFKHPVTLQAMRTMEGLEDMVLLRKGSRLSVQPVSAKEWKIVLAAGK